MMSYQEAGARSAGQAVAFASRPRSAALVYAEDMTEEVERLRQRFAGQGEYLQERLEEILEHPDDTPAGDRQVRRELRALERELQRRAG